MPIELQDKSITTLWVGNVDEKTTEDDLRYASVRFPFSELRSFFACSNLH